MERIGFAGLGRMGQAMAGRLLAGGFPLAVHNRTRAKADDLLAQGASWAATGITIPMAAHPTGSRDATSTD